MLEHLYEFATDFCELHDITCCTKKDYKYSHFQCKHNSNPIIAAYQECKFACQDIEKVEKYVAYVAAHELDSLINEKMKLVMRHLSWKDTSALPFKFAKKIVRIPTLPTIIKETLLP